jgi:hypothetical protein
MRSALIHSKSKHEPWNNDDAATKAKHSRQQSGTNTEPHQNERSLF